MFVHPKNDSKLPVCAKLNHFADSFVAMFHFFFLQDIVSIAGLVHFTNIQIMTVCCYRQWSSFAWLVHHLLLEMLFKSQLCMCTKLLWWCHGEELKKLHLLYSCCRLENMAIVIFCWFLYWNNNSEYCFPCQCICSVSLIIHYV